LLRPHSPVTITREIGSHYVRSAYQVPPLKPEHLSLVGKAFRSHSPSAKEGCRPPTTGGPIRMAALFTTLANEAQAYPRSPTNKSRSRQSARLRASRRSIRFRPPRQRTSPPWHAFSSSTSTHWIFIVNLASLWRPSVAAYLSAPGRTLVTGMDLARSVGRSNYVDMSFADWRLLCEAGDRMRLAVPARSTASRVGWRPACRKLHDRTRTKPPASCQLSSNA
jgi:hypothetical protein